MRYAEIGGRFTGCWDPQSSEFLHACVCACENKRWRDEAIVVGECFVTLVLLHCVYALSYTDLSAPPKKQHISVLIN